MGEDVDASAKHVTVRRGFALSLGLLACLFWAAIPRFDHGPRPRAVESAAIASLKRVASAQRQMMAMGEGVGEVGYLTELVDAGLLGPSFRVGDDGFVRRGQYLFAVFLPCAADSAGVRADRCWRSANAKSARNVVASDLAETSWLVYAWPAGDAGSRSFLLDADGAIFATDHHGGSRYVGELAPCPPGSGFAEVDGSLKLAGEGRDLRGHRWRAVR